MHTGAFYFILFCFAAGAVDVAVKGEGLEDCFVWHVWGRGAGAEGTMCVIFKLNMCPGQIAYPTRVKDSKEVSLSLAEIGLGAV